MKNEAWNAEVDLLKSIIEETELERTTKWGADVYVINNINVISVGAFKNYVSIWFYDGVFLTDPLGVLGNSQEGKTKALRHWKFYAAKEIDVDKVREYVLEAIQNAKMGKTWKPEKNSKVDLPAILEDAFEKNPDFKNAFFALTPGKQKEYIEHITSAKREATQLSRIEKMQPLVLRGEGLHDKYKK
ncbi:YdeI/OmpD-associated family protein [Litoribacter alkaliphilus]|uniref:YdeI/OmpD-associated family protein n=1 Tax=Litoribacter ruber TaxID=702568 RepID=A0AAP2G0M9_9BACT|nr:YdeI/OmpD-associated family protein [Litoribacter alkaliphilus]MBS9523129.1 YdeI/OmpD-associated family protein [Litoribacter alkaliphilus]